MTERNNPKAIITKKIIGEIQTALSDIGATDDEVKRIPRMSADKLSELAKRLDADPYLQAYIGSRGDTLEDDQILECLRYWNRRAA